MNINNYYINYHVFEVILYTCLTSISFLIVYLHAFHCKETVLLCYISISFMTN